MALITAGFWPTTYWPSRYWIADYWPEYEVVVAAVVGAPRRKRPPSIIAPHIPAGPPPLGELIRGAKRAALIIELDKIAVQETDLADKTAREFDSIRKGAFRSIMQVGQDAAMQRAQLEMERQRIRSVINEPKRKQLAKARAVRQENLKRKAAIKTQRLKNLKKARAAKKRKRKKKK